MDVFPLNPNNKVDRKSLPKPSIKESKAAPVSKEKLNRKEQEIVESWQGLLGLGYVSASDSFVSIGGDSLNFVRASIKLEKILGSVPKCWEVMPISELARAGGPRQSSALKPVDSTVLIRAIAIIFVIIEHLRIFSDEFTLACTDALFIASGYLFASFQLQSVLLKQSIAPVLSSIVKVAIPTVLYMIFLQWWTGDYELGTLLLYANFLPPQGTWQGGFWFIYVLLQVFLILAIILSIRQVRSLASTNGFALGVGLLVVSGLVAVVSPLLWSTDHLFDRVPHLHVWMIAAGWCALMADTTLKKLLVLALVILVESPFGSSATISTYYFTYGSVLLLMLAPTVYMFFPLNRIAHYLGGGSLFIYLTHWQFNNVAARLGLGEWPVLTLIFSLVGGVIVWLCWDRIVEIAGRLLRRSQVREEHAQSSGRESSGPVIQEPQG